MVGGKVVHLVVKGQATLSTIITAFFLFFGFLGILGPLYAFIGATINTLGPLEKVLVMLTGFVLIIGIVSLVTNRDDLATFLFGKQKF